jgi:endonuclease-3
VEERLIRTVDRKLADAYGREVGDRGVGNPLDGLILTILSQNTSDINSDRAFSRLKESFPTWPKALKADTAELEEAIRPGGISHIKAERIQQVLSIIREQLGVLDLRKLEGWETPRILDFLIALPGVGLKTAHVVLLFYYDRPAFPVDTHIYRITRRLGWVPEGADLERAHHILDAAIPDELKGRLHLNLIAHGRAVCTARRPRCDSCIILSHCPRTGVAT